MSWQGSRTCGTLYDRRLCDGTSCSNNGGCGNQNMSKFHVDKAFIGVHSINFNVGLTSIATPQMEVKKAIMKAAEKVYVLADSSKFGGGYLSVICPTNEVYKIITDDGVSAENVSKAKELGVPLVVA